jgi:hypothetical protein
VTGDGQDGDGPTRPADVTEEPSEAADAAVAVDPSALTAGDVETVVPQGEDPLVCERCGRPFPRDQADLLALHRGLAHWTVLTPAERDAYDDALAAEEADLRRFRLLALGALVLLYFGFLFAFALFT